jgi:hypothetical protein
MTRLIQQRTDYDCSLAAVAMAMGAPSWGSVWTEEDLAAVVGKGAHTGDILEKVKLERLKHWTQVGVYGHDVSQAASFLWRRPAILSVSSINSQSDWHAVYWDGEVLWDPQQGRPDRQYFKFLETVRIEQAYLLTDYVRGHYAQWKALKCLSEN